MDGHGAVGIGLADPGEADHRGGARRVGRVRRCRGAGSVHGVTLLVAVAPAADPVVPCYSRIVNSGCAGLLRQPRRPAAASVPRARADHRPGHRAGRGNRLPLALLARRSRRTEALVLGVSTGLYTIPSLALLPLLAPFTGLSTLTVVIGLALYALTILVRALLEGLRAVPAGIRRVGPWARVRRHPAAGAHRAAAGTAGERWPAWRVATVSTVALTTIGALGGPRRPGQPHQGRRHQQLPGRAPRRVRALLLARARPRRAARPGAARADAVEPRGSSA